jgi:hypothetical protein
LTLAEIREMSSQQLTAAVAELPGELFDERDAAWQATVRGHLVAALQAIPTDEEYAGLARVVADALARAEQL